MKEKTILETYEEKRERVQEFNLTSDLFASKVFEDVSACQELCGILLRDRTIELQSVRTQYVIRNLETHSMELDILAERNNGDIVGGKRGRYLIERKTDNPEDITDIGDEIQNTINVSNGVKERYYNLKYPTSDAEVDELLTYFKNSDPCYKTELFPRIVERVRHFKMHKEGVDIMCEIADRIRNEGREEGRKEGRKEGRVRGMIDAILELLEEFGQVPQRIVEHINSEDSMSVLSRWLKAAAKATSLAEFEANM